MSRTRWSAGAGLAVVLAGSVLLAQQTSSNESQQPYAQADQSYEQNAAQDSAQDPPSRVARLSELLGAVSVEPASVNQFSVGELNYPLTTGDRLYADTGANAELETGQIAVRLGQLTDLTVTAMTDELAQFGLAEGSVHLRAFSLNGTIELDTPNVAITLLQPGDVRVDVDASNDVTTVTVLQGQVQLIGDGVGTVLEQGQRVQLYGGDPVQMQGLRRVGADGLDRFSQDRDRLFEMAEASESQYLSPDTIGAADLQGNGDWGQDDQYGPVWYPSAMPVGWAPYTCGHWTWIAPWGWTWVDCAPWGFAPFHYGRWAHLQRGWGWVPGPLRLRPIYSPALVVFVGGPPVRGLGVTAWFALGPREPYVPWYHASTLYENRVNVTNIYSRNEVEVRNTYNQRTVNVYAGAGRGGQAQPPQYANRSLGTVAMQQTSFATGRPVAQGRVTVSAQALAGAPIVPHPMVTPDRQMVTPAPAQSVPQHMARPVLAMRGDAPTQAQGPVAPGMHLSARPMPAPASLTDASPVASQQRAPAGVAATENQRVPSSGRAPGAEVIGRPQQPAVGNGTSEYTAPIQRSQPLPQPAAAVRQPAQPTQPQPQRQEPLTARPLIHQAEPPEPRPSFEQQRQAIQSSDPGRPLGPQQLQNLRENQPAGPPQQREQPHPAPQAQPQAPRSAPAAPATPSNRR